VSNFLPLRRAIRVITIPSWQWSFEPGECEDCGAYVMQLLCYMMCTTGWLCDECSEQHECESE